MRQSKEIRCSVFF